MHVTALVTLVLLYLAMRQIVSGLELGCAADGLEEEYQPMVVDGEWQATPSGGLCMHADNVDLSKLNDESWPQPV